jgi:uncharacterized protein (DUF2141 family)
MAQKFRISFVLTTIMASLLSPLGVNSSLASDLTIELDGLKDREGQVCLSLFDSSKGFPDREKNAVQKQCVPNDNAPLLVTFKNIPLGSYAVAVLHDANQDNKINSNFFGIPTEGFGFSGNPTIISGPPKFNESAVLVTGASTTIQIQLTYL